MADIEQPQANPEQPKGPQYRETNFPERGMSEKQKEDQRQDNLLRKDASRAKYYYKDKAFNTWKVDKEAIAADARMAQFEQDCERFNVELRGVEDRTFKALQLLQTEQRDRSSNPILQKRYRDIEDKIRGAKKEFNKNMTAWQQVQDPHEVLAKTTNTGSKWNGEILRGARVDEIAEIRALEQRLALIADLHDSLNRFDKMAAFAPSDADRQIASNDIYRERLVQDGNALKDKAAEKREIVNGLSDIFGDLETKAEVSKEYQAATDELIDAQHAHLDYLLTHFSEDPRNTTEIDEAYASYITTLKTAVRAFPGQKQYVSSLHKNLDQQKKYLLARVHLPTLTNGNVAVRDRAPALKNVILEQKGIQDSLARMVAEQKSLYEYQPSNATASPYLKALEAQQDFFRQKEDQKQVDAVGKKIQSLVLEGIKRSSSAAESFLKMQNLTPAQRREMRNIQEALMRLPAYSLTRGYIDRIAHDVAQNLAFKLEAKLADPTVPRVKDIKADDLPSPLPESEEPKVKPTPAKPKVKPTPVPQPPEQEQGIARHTNVPRSQRDGALLKEYEQTEAVRAQKEASTPEALAAKSETARLAYEANKTNETASAYWKALRKEQKIVRREGNAEHAAAIDNVLRDVLLKDGLKRNASLADRYLEMEQLKPADLAEARKLEKTLETLLQRAEELKMPGLDLFVARGMYFQLQDRLQHSLADNNTPPTQTL